MRQLLPAGAAMALLEGRTASPILEEAYRWNSWAAPKNASGQLDHHAALTGDDLRDFVVDNLSASRDVAATETNLIFEHVATGSTPLLT